MTCQRSKLLCNAVQLEEGIRCLEYSCTKELPSEPMVSVVMITFNHDRYIAHAIDCVLKQVTTFSFEIVIGEDCSTDRTRAIVFEYAKKHPDKIRIITAERNVGFRQNLWRVGWSSRGQYLTFCEGDDYWHNTEKLQMQVDAMDANPECVMLHTDIDIAYIESKTKIKRYNWHRGYMFSVGCSRHERYERMLCAEELVFTPTACVRKNVYLDILLSDPYIFLRSQYLMGDVPLWVELARRGEFMYLDVSTATFQRLPESLSQSKSLSKKIEFLRSGIGIRLYYYKKYVCNAKRFFRTISRMATAALRMACLKRDREQVESIQNLLPCTTFTHRAFFLIARCRLVLWSYRYWDWVVSLLRRGYIKIRYGNGNNAQFVKPSPQRSSQRL